MKKSASSGRRHIRVNLPALEWVWDASGRSARITALGADRLLVENHTGLTDISDCRVLLNTRTGPVCVTGTSLSLQDIRPGALIIRGRLRRIELPCEGGEQPDA